MAVITRSQMTTSSAVEYQRVAKGTTPVVNRSDNVRATSNAFDEDADADGDGSDNGDTFRRSGTEPLIRPDELGEEDVEHETGVQEQLGNVQLYRRPLLQKRRELAQSLQRRMERVIASRGKIRMAAEVEMLKRQLSQCHDVARRV